jgi:phosphoribosylglycinamide formyltransferase 1
MKKHRLAILASGKGTNAARLIEYFRGHSTIEVAAVLTNKSTAGVLEIASDKGITSKMLSNAEFEEGSAVLQFCKDMHIHSLVLAGFLRQIPVALIDAFPNRILNIHPAILPDFGGKGMYGDFVHQAVLDSKKEYSGVTIHLVNANYDEGMFLCQAYTAVAESDTVASLRQKVQQLEHVYYPVAIENYLNHQL